MIQQRIIRSHLGIEYLIFSVEYNNLNYRAFNYLNIVIFHNAQCFFLLLLLIGKDQTEIDWNYYWITVSSSPKNVGI